MAADRVESAVETAVSLPVISSLGAAALVGVGLWRFVRPPPPAVLVWMPAVLVGGLVAGHDAERYLGEPIPRFRWVSLMPVVLALAAYTGAVLHSRNRRRQDWITAADATLYQAIAAIGITLCVPETKGLLLVVGPLLVAAVVAWLGWVRPSSTVELLAIGLLLAWITTVDGQSRGSALVGASACLAAAGLLPFWAGRTRVLQGEGPDRVERCVQLAVYGLTILICSRVAGIHPSVEPAVGIAMASLAGAGVVLAARDRRARPVAPGRSG